MLRYRRLFLALTATILLHTPTAAQVPAPLVDDGVFSFAVDVRVHDNAVVVMNVDIVAGSARSYGRHPDQFRVIATGKQGLPIIQITTFDPSWLRVYHSTLAETSAPSIDRTHSQKSLSYDRSMHEQTLPSEPPVEHTQIQERQMGDRPTLMPIPPSQSDLTPPSKTSPSFNEEWRRMPDVTLRYFLPFRADIRSILAGYPVGPQSKRFDVSRAIAKFCKGNSNACRRQR